MKIGPAFFWENESPGGLKTGNEAWRQVATRPLEALNAGLSRAPPSAGQGEPGGAG